ncbi:BatD family protein [Gallaecimonas kandeliae]|uniref:BatD family protein n=1 Tax=Gallaecimonas kandeliae TaxID=3029055 RepID=UPI002647DD84|nr:BatD family protein [Gallaecimonas kandeliae]WKE64185.1 BatD family protein [Gallaecimonas kandeliae]
MVKRPLLLLAAAWLAIGLPMPLLAATKVEATLNRNPVPAGEAVTLEVVVNDDMAADALDTSPLQKDFMVGNISTSRSTQINNFNVSRETRWDISLIATKPGHYTVPALKVDDLMTAPIKLEVVAEGASTKAQDLILDTQLSDTQVYPGAQLNYQVTLLVGQALNSGQISDPKLDKADIKRLGDDKESSQVRQGRRYHSFERSYAFFPKDTGTQVIEPPMFTGVIATQDSRGFYQNREVGKVGQPQTFTVLPVPDPSKPWLPARDLTLEERWSQDPKDWKVGQPITRTLVLTATGTQATNLPPLEMPVPDRLKVYPDQKDRKSYINDGWMMAQQLSAAALVPTKAGSFTLPEVDVTWFDTLAKKYRVATLPARTLTIAPGAASQSQVQPPPAKVETTAGFWPWLSATLALGWLASLAFWLKSRLGKTKIKENPEQESPGWLRLRQAVLSKDPAKAGQALLAWAGDKYGVHSLEELAQHLQSPALSQAITELQASRFAPSGQSWQGDALWQALQHAKAPEPPPPGSGLYAAFRL